MGYLLKESLKTLCGVKQWAYAVFWKFGCHNPKLLIWEDCYYETASFSGLATYHDDNSSWVSTETRDSHPSVRDGGKVHFLVNKMMVDNQVHVLGEGLVGRVAFTGNHQWVLAENYYREAHPPEVEKELCLQFAAGMQTIAVIPVLPHGVVQFGSSLTIIENTMFLSDVASLLHLVYLSELPKEHTLDTINPHCSFDTFNYISNSADPPVIDIQTSFAGPHHHTENSQPAKLDFLTSNLSTSVVVKAEVIPSNPEMWSTLKFHSPSSYYSDEGNISSKNRSSSGLKNAIFSKDEANVGKNPLPRFDDHLGGNDLFDVLGPDFKNKLFDGSLNNESGDNISAKRGLEESVSCTTTFTNPCSMPYGWFGVSEGPFGVPKCTATPSPMGSVSFGVGPTKEESGAYSHGGSSYVSQLSSWIGGDQKAKSVSTGCSKKGATGRKRLKSGENPRPRPKDRQLIQDRVKELREIVPNGAKCSIDSLLERTIKHMIFLQSVTKHADKLTQSGESKVISKDGGLIMKDNFEGGATWAYEVGSQSMVCPIIVEDLNQPHQMLVEMLCEERGLFLEIADIIRGLGLTILKGVMETRKDKIWARFVVEAIRDVTRIEIFISLVRLLEQAAKNGGPQSDNNAAQTPTAQQFHQLAPVPLTPHVFP